MVDEPQKETEATKDTEPKRADDFIGLYANNVVVDATAWDLRLTFGQFDKLPDGSLINTHRLSVTMPFALAKLMLYWIEFQVTVYEAQIGRSVGIRPDILPPEPPPVPPESQNDEKYIKLRDTMAKARERLIASLE